MIQPRTYTELVPVRITAELRAELQDKLGQTGIGAAMRDVALRAIGRDDLVVSEGRDESGHLARQRQPKGPWVMVAVNLTKEQRQVLSEAAKGGGIALSALLRTAVVAELGLPAVEPRERADGKGKWPLGKRKASKAPPAKRKADRANEVATKERAAQAWKGLVKK